MSRAAVIGVVLIAIAVSLLGAASGRAQVTERRARVTITLLANNVGQPGYEQLIKNFERVYPDIEIVAQYASSNATLYQLERTELAAGNGPDVFVTYPGCGTPISVCTLAKAGYLAPMVKKPWTARSVPIVTSLDKRGQDLYAFTPIVSLYGVFTNDQLFKRLNLKVPETFPELLALCGRAKAAGAVAIILPGNSPSDITNLLMGMAVPLVYAKDKGYLRRLKAGTATFAGNAGWQQVLQRFSDLNGAGCFQQGAVGASYAVAAGQFAQGQGLMLPAITNQKGIVDAGGPKFTISHHLFPGGSDPRQTRTYVHLSLSLAVNAHASDEKQKAAQSFVDFVARPAQNALFARIQGGMTQPQFKKRQVPTFMASESTAVARRAYVISPVETLWNTSVYVEMQQDEIGIITGQRSVSDVLKAMDAAWRLGPD
jgi:raffinose/stachyose/melibiose transport system substrate-binding protein